MGHLNFPFAGVENSSDEFRIFMCLDSELSSYTVDEPLVDPLKEGTMSPV
jgi:hypothetical protein